jgi:hypothetical protein
MGRQTSRDLWSYPSPVPRDIRNRQTACFFAATGRLPVDHDGSQDNKRIEPRCREFRGSSNLNSPRWVNRDCQSLSCKERAKSEQSNRVKFRQAGQSARRKRNPGKCEPAARQPEQPALSSPAFRSVRWCDRGRLVTKLQARRDTNLAPAGLARTGSGFGLLPPTCPRRDNRVRRRPARHGQAASPSHQRRAEGR